jgi:hypothetical protein
MAIALENQGTQSRTQDTCSRSLARYRRKETIEFRVIFMAAFSAFFVAALVERIMPKNWQHHVDGEETHHSVVAQARHAANTCAAYALMG